MCVTVDSRGLWKRSVEENKKESKKEGADYPRPGRQTDDRTSRRRRHVRPRPNPKTQTQNQNQTDPFSFSAEDAIGLDFGWTLGWTWTWTWTGIGTGTGTALHLHCTLWAGHWTGLDTLDCAFPFPSFPSSAGYFSIWISNHATHLLPFLDLDQAVSSDFPSLTNPPNRQPASPPSGLSGQLPQAFAIGKLLRLCPPAIASPDSAIRTLF